MDGNENNFVNENVAQTEQHVEEEKEKIMDYNPVEQKSAEATESDNTTQSPQSVSSETSNVSFFTKILRLFGLKK